MGEDLQFDRAESTSGGSPGVECDNCARSIATAYYEAGGKTLCPACKVAFAQALSGSGRYLRGLALGTAGALVGALVYFGVAALTGYEVGLIAILVGFLAGKGVQRGSAGAGGLKHQLTAVVLTYFAISVSYNGVLVRELAMAPGLADSLTAGLGPPAGESIDVGPIPVGPPMADDEPAGEAFGGDPALGGDLLGGVIGLAVLLATLPLLVWVSSMPGSMISALIVFFGMAQAWQMNKRLDVSIEGPFAVGGPDPEAGAREPVG